MKAMIFAAGKGTRLKPLTDKIPKALVEVCGVPMLERSILHLKKYGVSDIIVNVHHFADQILNFLERKNNFGLHIEISDERDSLLETGGGLKNASWFFSENEDFILINSDIITDLNLKRLIDAHQQKNALATLVVRNRKSSRCFLFDHQMRLSGWKNFKENKEIRFGAHSELLSYPFSGIHIINSSIFKLMNQEGRFSIVDTYLELCTSQPIYGYQDHDSTWFDIGDVAKLREAEEGLRKG